MQHSMPRIFLRAIVFVVTTMFLFTAGAQTDSALPALVEVLKAADDAQLQLDILKGMSEALKGRRSVPMPAGWEAVAGKLEKSTDANVRDLARALSLTFGSQAALTSLRQQLIDSSAEAAARRAALDSLVTAKDPQLAPILRQLMQDAALRGAALRALAGYDDPTSPAAILAIYSNLGPAEKKDALNTLAARAASARALLAAIGSGAISTKDLSADIVRQLRFLKQPEIDLQVTKFWGVTRESAADKLAEMAKFKGIVLGNGARPAEPPRGRAIFARTCQQCHTLFDLGGKVGPDLTGSNRAELDYILHNIIDPNAEIPNDYRTSNIETRDERFITGIVTRQDSQVVAVVTANETLTIPRAEIKSIVQGELSMMPEGLLANFSNEEVRDLIAYLGSRNQTPMLATAENASLFFNGKDLSFWEDDAGLWKVEQGELVGISKGLKRNEFLKSQLLLSDFRLVVKVKLVPNTGNSGIQFRSAALPDGEMKGCQADVGVGWWGKLYEERGRGLLWKDSGEAHVKLNDWNTYEVLAVGSKIRTAINGRLCVDLDDPQISKSGVVGFQLHAGGAFEVRYKDIQLELNPKFELGTMK
jgi:putative heme-binding domain-containing protein